MEGGDEGETEGTEGEGEGSSSVAEEGEDGEGEGEEADEEEIEEIEEGDEEFDDVGIPEAEVEGLAADVAGGRDRPKRATANQMMQAGGRQLSPRPPLLQGRSSPRSSNLGPRAAAAGAAPADPQLLRQELWTGERDVSWCLCP